MDFKNLKNKIKKEQKELAATIRILKAARKPHIYESNPKLYDSLGDLETKQYNYRHRHIAYCEFFNKTPYEDIERKCHEKPYRGTIDGLKNIWEEEVKESEDETLCVS